MIRMRCWRRSLGSASICLWPPLPIGRDRRRAPCSDQQYRRTLSSFAYVLLYAVRRLGLQGTELARAQCETIRFKRLKIGAQVRINVRRAHSPRVSPVSTCSARETLINSETAEAHATETARCETADTKIRN